jgi:NADPH-dependent ferric siderophore reductase
VQVFGPRGSLDLSALEQAPVLVGDETSFGLAGALAAEGRHVPVAQLYEVADPAGAATALAAVDGAPADLVPRDDGRDVLADRLVELVRSHPDAPLVLTGCAQTIRHLRGRIKDEGLRPSAKVKAYWDENRSGLD